MADLFFWLKFVGAVAEMALYFLECTLWIITIIFQKCYSVGFLSPHQISTSFLYSLVVLCGVGEMPLVGFLFFWPQYGKWKLIFIFVWRFNMVLISTVLLFICCINKAQIPLYFAVLYPIVHISCSIIDVYQLYKYSRSVL